MYINVPVYVINSAAVALFARFVGCATSLSRVAGATVTGRRGFDLLVPGRLSGMSISTSTSQAGVAGATCFELALLLALLFREHCAGLFDNLSIRASQALPIRITREFKDGSLIICAPARHSRYKAAYQI